MISNPSVQYFFRTNSCYGKGALNCFFYIVDSTYIIEPYILTFVFRVQTHINLKNNSHIICLEKATQCFFQKCMRNYRKKLPQKITTKNYHNITTNRPTIEYTRKLIPPNHPATPPKKKVSDKSGTTYLKQKLSVYIRKFQYSISISDLSTKMQIQD